MTRVLAAVLLATLSGIRTAPQTAEAVRNQLLGNWKLVKYEVFDANGSARPGRYDVGRVAYDTSGEMTAHLMHAGDDHAYLGYFGPFTVDAAKGTVTHHVIGSSNVNWIGSDQVRYYGFSADGNQLTLSLKSGDRITQTLTWVRVK
jgi:Lipocalin-like domain